jgi:hypothetical protein
MGCCSGETHSIEMVRVNHICHQGIWTVTAADVPHPLQSKRGDTDASIGIHAARLPKRALCAALARIEHKSNLREVLNNRLIVFEATNDVITVDSQSTRCGEYAVLVVLGSMPYTTTTYSSFAFLLVKQHTYAKCKEYYTLHRKA